MDRGTGAAGEEHIAHFLRSRGYDILARNYHCRFGEIDIIAQNRQYLVFVEVKTREEGGLSSPFEAVTPAKQRRVILAAEVFLEHYSGDGQPRFDVAAVYTRRGKIVGEEYIEDAFRL